MNIAETLRRVATECGSAPALIDVHAGKDRIVSFQQLERATAIAAGEVSQAGIQQSDSVLILHPVSIELYVFLIALFRLGAIAVFLDPSAGREHIEHCCTSCPPSAFFGSPRAQLLRIWNAPLRRIPHAFCSGWFPGARTVGLQTSGSELDAITAVDSNAPALVTFTSGSTGRPKAALRSHGFLIAQHNALKTSLHLQAGAVDLTTLPVFVLANLASGVTSVLPDADMRKPGKINPAPVIAQLRRHTVTTTAASPAFIARLAEHCEQARNPIQELKRVFMGGAPVFPSDLRRAAAAFPDAEITAVYGSTEAEPMAEISLSNVSEDDIQRMQHGSGLLAGRPARSISLRVICECWGTPIGSLSSSDFAKLCTQQRDVGEIVVSGEHVLPGYLGGAGDAETKFDVGGTRWHRTGDLGYFDDQGRLWLMGRASAKISDDKGVLYPFAVECAAQQVTGVRRAALASCSGQRILAVELDTAAAHRNLEQIIKWARLNEIRVVSAIPMDKRHNAKVDYTALFKLLAGRDRRWMGLRSWTGLLLRSPERWHCDK